MSGTGRQLPSGVETRALGLEDVDAVAALIAACDRTYLDWAPGWDPPEESEERAKWTQRLSSGDGWTLGAFEGEKLVGMVMAEQAMAGDDGPHHPDRGHLRSLFVDPSHWREGIGGELLSRAERAMLELGYKTAELETPEAAPARQLYERAGWTVLGHQGRHKRLGLPMVKYEKALS